MKRLLFIAISAFYALGGTSVYAQENHLAQAKGLLQHTSSNVSFEENKGQVTGQDANRVKFTVKDQNLKIFLLNDGIAYQFEKINYLEGYDPKVMSDPAAPPRNKNAGNNYRRKSV